MPSDEGLLPADCSLCSSKSVRPYAITHGRRYVACETCGLVSMVPADRLGAEAERAHYATHENDPADEGYRRFLDRLAGPLTERLASGAVGLDFGSGPGPTLSVMLEERGFRTRIYDPFFAADPSVLEHTFDFITCTETAEHFFDPRSAFERLDAVLRPGGWLGVMTQLLTSRRIFTQWRYARDPTHVTFYRPQTLAWIAAHFGWTLERPRRDVALFHKPPA